jgi:hypothetical protein
MLQRQQQQQQQQQGQQPTCVTTPADSWPMTMGALTSKSPMRPTFQKCTSEPQIPTAFIDTRT